MKRRKETWIDGECFVEYEEEKRPPSTEPKAKATEEEKRRAEEEKQREERRWCLRALGQRWLPHSVRNAIVKELRVSVHRYNTAIRDFEALVEGAQVKAHKEVGMDHEAAIKEVADAAGVKPGAVKQRTTRARRRARNRAAAKN